MESFSTSSATELGVSPCAKPSLLFVPSFSLSRALSARRLGDFSYFNSFMSQPKFQLETFKAWAGISSDISYYLNSHHIDLHACVATSTLLGTILHVFFFFFFFS